MVDIAYFAYLHFGAVRQDVINEVLYRRRFYDPFHGRK